MFYLLHLPFAIVFDTVTNLLIHVTRYIKYGAYFPHLTARVPLPVGGTSPFQKVPTLANPSLKSRTRLGHG